MKGQITTFIIMSLVLIISVFLTIAIVNHVTESVTESGIKDQFGNEIKSLKSYVGTCIDNVGEDKIREIGLLGGSFNDTLIGGFRPMCYQAGYIGCVNSMTTGKMVEHELEREMIDDLSGCINLSLFRKAGYNVTNRSMSLAVTIGLDEVTIVLNYPVSVIKGDEVEREDQFLDVIDLPLGKSIELANDIINTELSTGRFDHDKYMMVSDVIIEKHRPYPNIAYTFLFEDYEFRFALAGEDTVSQISYNPDSQALELGCCEVGGNCFVNADINLCNDAGGFYRPGPCECSVIELDNDVFLIPCPECSDCDQTWNPNDLDYTGPSRKHGESWCIYDSITNRGMDYVGSRHYKHICIDGVEYAEECRDFREEMCVEYEYENTTHALCRINRWSDCTECTTQACCEDPGRDCFWNRDDFTDMELGCHPMVSPGFRFWEGSGVEVCQEGFSQREFRWKEPRAKWLNENAKLCTKLGDCGNYRNIADRKSRGGVFELDLRNDPEEGYMFNMDGLNVNYRTLRKDPVVSDRPFKEFDKPGALVPQIISNTLYNVDLFYNLGPIDFLNPYSQPNIRFKNILVCGVYPGPMADDCEICSIDPYKPCSEYRCMSLGNCIYDSANTSCYHAALDNLPPEIEIVAQNIRPENLTLHLKEYKGIEIEDVMPYDLLNVKVLSNEDTKCKFDFFPSVPDVMPAIWFGDMSYSTEHNVSIRVPPHISVPRKLLHLMDISSVTGLYEWFELPRTKFEQVAAVYAEEIELYRQRTGDDIIATANRYLDRIENWKLLYDTMIAFLQDMINIVLTQFDNNGYYLFVSCQDRAGNTNDEHFIKFEIGKLDTAPVILGSEPDNNTKVFDDFELTLYVSEPSDCSYSLSDVEYTLMENRMECTKSMYDMDPIMGGSYTCSANLALTNKTYYFRCLDKPEDTDEYELNLFEGGAFFAYGGIPDYFYEMTAPSRIDITARSLTDQVKFIVNKSYVDLYLYFDDIMECRVTDNQSEQFDLIADDFEPCQISGDVGKGVYSCAKRLNVNDGERIEQDIITENYSIEFHFSPTNFIEDPNQRFFVEFDENEIYILRNDYLVNNKTDININNSYIRLTLAMWGDSECRWGETDAMFTGLPNIMVCTNDGILTTCESDFLVPDEGYRIYAKCRNFFDQSSGNNSKFYIKCREENSSTIFDRLESDVYSINLNAGEELEVVVGNVTEYGILNLTANVNGDIAQDGIVCGYNFGGSGLLGMNVLNETTFIKRVSLDPGTYTVQIRCWNRYGHEAQGETTISS